MRCQGQPGLELGIDLDWVHAVVQKLDRRLPGVDRQKIVSSKFKRCITAIKNDVKVLGVKPADGFGHGSGYQEGIASGAALTMYRDQKK